MEALGAFASVVTIVGLIRPTANFVKSLRGITSDDGHVAKEIERMASGIQASANSIDVSLKALKGHASKLEKMQRAPSEVLQYIIDNKSLDLIVSSTESIRKQMRHTTRDLNDTNNRSKILRKISWLLLDKMEVESLFPEMQLVASSLNLVCPIIGLEINRYLLNKSSGEVAECLKQEIVYGELVRHPDLTEHLPSHSVTVPRGVPSEAIRHTSSSPESFRPHSAVPSSSPQTPDTPATPQSPDVPKSPRIDTSARTVGPREGVVRAIEGHLINNGKAMPVKSAMIDYLGSFNYISVKTATQLGLDIQELDPGEHSHTQDGEHVRILPGKVIGKVTGVGWRKSGWRKPIPVEFLVKDSYRGRMYEHVAFGMVFASDFDAAGGGS
ncbi:uncharacterized protein FTJAE_8001 [Fusarium tjaetaba]|uniref:Uncharacterized protein n=1 Tax=Fusarium tjaetaba TaxID=1567544 RepID=A0A8H5R8I8_9HYPO|nr:uncharacterized protein FTJAE_8001 [Fusarium tjaetaba]KAF5631135.1 hypothetical protein FTJAE_8001 [Fusarium tjaetaba]